MGTFAVSSKKPSLLEVRYPTVGHFEGNISCS